MSAAMDFVASYVVSALWQLPLLVAAAWCGARCVRAMGPRAEHRVWCASMGIALVSPAVDAQVFARGLLLARAAWVAVQGLFEHHHGAAVERIEWSTQAGVVLHASHLLTPALQVLVRVVAGLVVVQCVRRAVGLWRLRALRASARELPATTEAARVAAVWLELSGHCVRRVALRVSDAVRGPVTIGDRQALVLLPAAWIGTVNEDDLRAALAHECAHVERRDFRNNLVLRWLALPLAWHPAMWLLEERMAETREMVCDARASEVVAGGGRYARSLLNLAATLLEGPRSTNLYAIGVFDANQLERRMMRVTEKKQRVSRSVQLAAMGAVVALGVSVCGAATVLHTRVTMQDDAPAGKTQSVPASVMAGQLLSRFNPVYPPEAKKARVQGSVVLGAIIGKDGSVSELKVISGPAELQQSALDAVRQWKYKPYLLNGEPTEVDTTITVNFTFGN